MQLRKFPRFLMEKKTLIEAENSIRTFLSQELMKEWAVSIPSAENFELDSIDQVDLRVFLEEHFGLKIVEGQKPFQSIQIILSALASSESLVS